MHERDREHTHTHTQIKLCYGLFLDPAQEKHCGTIRATERNPRYSWIPGAEKEIITLRKIRNCR